MAIEAYDFSSETDVLANTAELAGVEVSEDQRGHWRNSLTAARFLLNLGQRPEVGPAQFVGEVSLIAAGAADSVDEQLKPYTERIGSMTISEQEGVFRNIHTLGEAIVNQQGTRKMRAFSNFVFRTGQAVAGFVKVPAGPGEEEAEQLNNWLEKAFGYAFLINTSEHLRELHRARLVAVTPEEATKRMLVKRANAIDLEEEFGGNGATYAYKLAQLVESNWNG